MTAFKCLRVTEFYANQTRPKVGGTDRCVCVLMYTCTQRCKHTVQLLPKYAFLFRKKSKLRIRISPVIPTCTFLVTWQMVTSDIFQFHPSTLAFQCFSTICTPYVPSQTQQSGSIKSRNPCGRATLNTDTASSWHTPVTTCQSTQHHNSEDINLQHCCEELKDCTYWKIWQQTNITVIILGWQVLVTA